MKTEDNRCDEITKESSKNSTATRYLPGYSEEEEIEIIRGAMMLQAALDDVIAERGKKIAEELRDVADILKITEGTDANIKRSIESILRIADRLERKKNEKE